MTSKKRKPIWFESLRHLAREYTAGLEARDVKRLFGKDAQRVYAVLARDQAAQPEPAGRIRRFFWRARLLFFGMSYKLTPARRMLFAVSILGAFLGFFKVSAEMGNRHVSIDFSPMWFSLSIMGLMFLLALELADRILVRDELEVARQLQRDLLPREAPAIAGCALAHSYRTANEIGGDYYEFLPLPDGRLALLTGDASGHGMAAGLLMATAKAAIGTALDVDPAPAKVAELLNRALCRTGSRRAFMTLFYGLFEPGSGAMDFVCAGHPFPLLRRASGEVVEIGRPGLPLGMRESIEIAKDSLTLEVGDTLVLYTDGLVEAIGLDGQAFGFERLKWLAGSGGNPQELHDRILAALDNHLGREPLTDDVSVVVLGRNA